MRTELTVATALAGTLLATCLISGSAQATSLPVLKSDATGIVTLVGKRAVAVTVVVTVTAVVVASITAVAVVASTTAVAVVASITAMAVAGTTAAVASITATAVAGITATGRWQALRLQRP